jgi:hypothetical protein
VKVLGEWADGDRGRPPDVCLSCACVLRSQTSRWWALALAHGMVGAEACGRDQRSGDAAGLEGAQRNNRTAVVYVRKATRSAMQAAP